MTAPKTYKCCAMRGATVGSATMSQCDGKMTPRGDLVVCTRCGREAVNERAVARAERAAKGAVEL